MSVVSKVDDVPPICNTGLAVSQDLIKKDPGLITRYIKAIQESVDYIQKNPEPVIAFIQKQYSLDAKQAGEVYRLTDPATSMSTSKQDAQASIQRMLDFSKERNEVPANINFADAADLSLYP
jgi:ABC-type nitrate/sulfonate/bicarbonate transport system substrate-binding protein